MTLSTEERIATTDLLMKRDAAYARVSEIETEIDRLLQGDYPFPTPASIPLSQTKRKAKKAPKAKPSKRAAIKLRRLKAGECAYRYRWLERGAEKEATAVDARLVEQFIKSPPAGIRILAVETVDIDSALIETLFIAENA